MYFWITNNKSELREKQQQKNKTEKRQHVHVVILIWNAVIDIQKTRYLFRH